MFVLGVIALVYYQTVGVFEREAREALRREFVQVRGLYIEGGLRRISQDMIERSSADGPLMYMLTGPAGDVIVGEFSELPEAQISERLEDVEFPASVERDNGQTAQVRVQGVIGRLDVGGPILLVSRDMSDQDAAASRILNLLVVGMGAGLLLALIAGLAAGRQAAARAEELSRTTRDVFAGDLSRRAKIAGGDDEFNRLAHDLNKMLDRLQKLVLQTRTAGDAIAHDLRSPLSRMIGRIEAALEAPASSENDREALIKAMEEADRLLKTFNAVMQISRLESANTWQYAGIDLSAVAAEFAEFYEPVAEEAQVQFSTAIAPNLRVIGDERLIGQVLLNLIENALKYTPTGGAIAVEVRLRSDGAIELLVEDDGPGIPASQRARVLERFVRLEEHRNSPGSGLGLSLVAAVANAHRARLELRDGRRSGSGPGLGVALIFPAAGPR